MKHRKLRIAWLVVWGIAAMLLISLWVQSYWSRSSVSGKIANCFVIVETQHGEAMVNVVTHYTKTMYLNWHSRPIPSEDSPTLPVPKSTRGRFGIFWWPYRNGGGCMIFLLWPVMVFAAIGALSFMSTAVAALTNGLKLQFSLRTLLIATTLVAVGLSLIAWLSR